jgi:hypothetical protein
MAPNFVLNGQQRVIQQVAHAQSTIVAWGVGVACAGLPMPGFTHPTFCYGWVTATSTSITGILRNQLFPFLRPLFVCERHSFALRTWLQHPCWDRTDCKAFWEHFATRECADSGAAAKLLRKIRSMFRPTSGTRSISADYAITQTSAV